MLDLRDIMLNTLTHAFYAAFYLHIFNSFLKFKIFIHVEQFLALSTKETFQNKLLHGVRDFEDVMFSLSSYCMGLKMKILRFSASNTSRPKWGDITIVYKVHSYVDTSYKRY